MQCNISVCNIYVKHVHLCDVHSTEKLHFHQNAANRPYVAWVAPAEAQDHLRRAIVPRADYRCVVLVIVGSRAEVDQFDPTGLGDFPVLKAPRPRGRHSLVNFVIIAHQQNVFGLQILSDRQRHSARQHTHNQPASAARVAHQHHTQREVSGKPFIQGRQPQSCSIQREL